MRVTFGDLVDTGMLPISEAVTNFWGDTSEFPVRTITISPPSGQKVALIEPLDDGRALVLYRPSSYKQGPLPPGRLTLLGLGQNGVCPESEFAGLNGGFNSVKAQLDDSAVAGTTTFLLAIGDEEGIFLYDVSGTAYSDAGGISGAVAVAFNPNTEQTNRSMAVLFGNGDLRVGHVLPYQRRGFVGHETTHIPLVSQGQFVHSAVLALSDHANTVFGIAQIRKFAAGTVKTSKTEGRWRFRSHKWRKGAYDNEVFDQNGPGWAAGLTCHEQHSASPTGSTSRASRSGNDPGFNPTAGIFVGEQSTAAVVPQDSHAQHLEFEVDPENSFAQGITFAQPDVAIVWRGGRIIVVRVCQAATTGTQTYQPAIMP